MGRGETVVELERGRIIALAEKGIRPGQIAKRLRRSRSTVSRVLREWREASGALRKKHAEMCAMFLSALDTSHREIGAGQEARTISPRLGMNDKIAMPDQIDSEFIAPLLTHFAPRRRVADQFLADLRRYMADENFTIETLLRAVEIFTKTRAQTGFPSVALCISTCHRIAAESAVAGAESGTGSGATTVAGDASPQTVNARPARSRPPADSKPAKREDEAA